MHPTSQVSKLRPFLRRLACEESSRVACNLRSNVDHAGMQPLGSHQQVSTVEAFAFELPTELANDNVDTA